MNYIHTTPHCGRSCWLQRDGKEYHFHAQSRRHHKYRKGSCKRDCCVTPNRLQRRRDRAALRRELLDA